MNEYLKKYAKEAKNSNKTCFGCYFYLKSLETDKEWHDTILSICLNPEYKWFGERDITFSNWYDSKDKTMQGTLIEKSKQNPVGCSTPHWCKTGRILEDAHNLPNPVESAPRSQSPCSTTGGACLVRDMSNRLIRGLRK